MLSLFIKNIIQFLILHVMCSRKVDLFELSRLQCVCCHADSAI